MWLPVASLISVVAGGELRWTAPDQACPSAAQVRARIDAAGGLGELEVDAVVTEAPQGGWTLTLRVTLDEVSDERTLGSEACGELADAAVLLVATRLDEARTVVPEPEASVPVEEPEAPQASAPPSVQEESLEPAPQEARTPIEPAQPRQSSLPTGLTFGAGVGIGLGSVPAPGVPVEGALGVAWPRVRVGLRARYHVAPVVDLGDDARTQVILGTAGPEVCARPSWRRLEFPLCAQLSTGGSRVLVRGAARPRGGAWLEAGVDAGIAWFFAARWAATARFGASAPIVASRYARGDQQVWNPSPVGGRVVFGVEFLLPIQKWARPEKSR